MSSNIEYEGISVDEKTQKVIIVKKEIVDVDSKDIEEIKKKLKKELIQIIREVKLLKRRAEDIQNTLKTLEKY